MGARLADVISYSSQSVSTESDSLGGRGLWVTLPPRESGSRVTTSLLQGPSPQASPWHPQMRKPTQDAFCIAPGAHLSWPRRRKKDGGGDTAAAKASWGASHSRIALPELCRDLATGENARKIPANFRGSTLVGQQPRENKQLWFPSKQHMLFAGLFRTAVG